MRISQDFVVREIAGEHIVVPTGQEALKFHGLIALNEVGAFLWKLLQEKERTAEDLITSLCEEYEVDTQSAREDIAEFLQTLRDRDMLKEKL